MYQFNLLPPPYQTVARRWIIGRHLKAGLMILNTALLAMLGLLLVANVSFDRFASFDQVAVTAPNEETDTTHSVASIKQQMQQLTTIQSTHPHYVELIHTVIGLLPNDLLLSQVSVQYEDARITLNGTASTRDDLKNLQFTIEQDDRFEIVTFPFEVFTEDENIPFSIELEFKPESFRYPVDNQQTRL